MDKTNDHQIVPGVSVTPEGQATVDPSVADLLFDLAIKLEESTDLPVDVEHVLAAIILASRRGELDRNAPLSSGDPPMLKLLAAHVKTVFTQFGGKVSGDD